MSDQEPTIEISTLKPPTDYTPTQLMRAMIAAAYLGAGEFVLCEKPEM